MYPHSPLWHYLWIAPHVLQFVLALVMLRRGLFREFPMFFAYTIFQMVEEGSLFVMDHSAAISANQYWCAHWVGVGIDVALRFAIIVEIFSSVFKKYAGLTQLSRIVFRGAAVVLLMVAIAVAARAPGDGTLPIIARVHVLALAVSVMQSGLLLLLIGCSTHLGLFCRSFPYGIAFGLGIFASVDLATETLRVWTGSIAGYGFDFVTMATYHCCVLIWLIYALAPEAARSPAQEVPTSNLEQWNAELQRLLLQ